MPIDVQRLRTEFVGRYAVEETVGSGGTSTVFRAVDMQLHRTVAIKVLLPELSFGLGEDRFLREIDTAARLSHPRIVPLFASGQVSGLLYYVMPFIEGESLRRRLERERQFPIEDALRITHEVGEALHYAHSHGVVHRDITPGNVMLTEAGAVVMDFGIAKSSESTDPSPITQTGQVVGTLGYMSPEQASGERNLDSRSDLYSLACLLYEMLAGEAPYSGSNARAILAKQLAQPVSSVRIVRDTVPVAVDLALQRAMAKSAADRFASVHEFLDALDSEAKPDRSPDRGQRMKRAGWAAAAMLILAVGTWLTVTRGGSIASDADVAPDTSLYALFPFQRPEGSTTDLNEVQRLEDALDHWDGLGVVSQLQLREALADLDDDLTIETAARLAAEYGAGRFIWGEIQPLGDSVRVRAGLYDAASNGVQLEDQAFRVAATLEHADSLFRVMARELLFRGDPPDDEHAFASRSLPALKDLRRGLRAVSEWDLAAADAAFESARKNDSEYASASLWVALVRRWRGRPETEWVVAANQAFLRRSQLSDAERSAADAVMSAVTGDLGAACPLWDQMTEAEPDSFVNWYGLAHCLAQDSAVVRDPESPSGWAFRTSYSQALAAHEEAFRLQPAILASFQRTSYEPLQNLYMVGGNQRRGGWSDSLEFYADPVWTSDTLGFVPYPRVAGGGGPVSDLAEASEAVTQLRLKLVRVARTWSSQAPGDGHAKHALGLALALIGDATALDTLRAARALVTEPWDDHRVKTSEVWIRLSLAFPRDAGGLLRARALADSLLQDSTAAVKLDPELAVGLAALTGRASLAAAYAREAARLAASSPDDQFSSSFAAAPPLAGSGPALLVFSALGGPPDSLSVLERAVTRAIDDRLPPDQREEARFHWLNWPASQAFPERYGLASELQSGDALLDAQTAWFNGDTTAVRAYLVAARQSRQDILPAHRTLDTLFPEAVLWWLLGEPEAAVEWLDPTFGALSQVHPANLALPPNSGALVRAAALRARLAQALGRAGEAAVWARAVEILWSDADDFQQQTVDEMRGLLQ